MFSPKNIAVIGASGSMGGAFYDRVKQQYPMAHICAFSRSAYQRIDYDCEASISSCAQSIAKDQCWDLVIVTNGLLHEHGVMPEKSLKDLSAEKFHRLFQVNAVTPALIAKYFLPKLNRHEKSVFAVLSARIGSVSDNRLGGWYAYRSAKAALNMIIKSAAIETARVNKEAIVVGLHPGTVDSALSKPFQSAVVSSKIFTPEYAASQLIQVIENLDVTSSGKCVAWNGQEILP